MRKLVRLCKWKILGRKIHNHQKKMYLGSRQLSIDELIESLVAENAWMINQHAISNLFSNFEELSSLEATYEFFHDFQAYFVPICNDEMLSSRYRLVNIE